MMVKVATSTCRSAQARNDPLFTRQVRDHLSEVRRALLDIHVWEADEVRVLICFHRVATTIDTDGEPEPPA